MTYSRSFGRPGFLRPFPLLLTTTRYFVGRPNDVEPGASPVERGRPTRPFDSATPPGSHSHTVPLGAWSARFRCPLCGAPREEIIGRFTDSGLEML